MSRHQLRRLAVRAVVVAALGSAMVGSVAACGGDNGTTGASSSPTSSSASVTSSSSTAAGTTTACEDGAALKASLEALTKVRPLQDGTDAVSSAVASVKSSLSTAATSATAALQPDIEQVRTALAALESATSGLSADNLRDKAPAISAALLQVGTATSALTTTLSSGCPAG